MKDLYARIFADAEFQALQRRRSRLSWALAGLMTAAFFGFILVVAFAPELLAVPLGPHTVVTWAIPVGVSVIVIGLLLTGVYVYYANGEFDRANAAIVRRLEQEGEREPPAR